MKVSLAVVTIKLVGAVAASTPQGRLGMSYINLYGPVVFDLAYYFIIYSFLGWVIETLYAGWEEHRFVNRGFLNGPFCPIYGFGIVALLLTLRPVFDNLPLLFLGSVVLTSTIEYSTGWLLETVFHHKWWDYSNRRFNLNGRICLRFSLYWGIAAVVIIKMVHPFITAMVDKIPLKAGELGLYLLALYFMFDMIYTLISLAALKSLLNEMYEFAQEAVDRLEAVKDNSVETIEENIEDLKIHYEHLMNRMGLRHQRILNAFPNLRKLRQDFKVKHWHNGSKLAGTNSRNRS